MDIIDIQHLVLLNGWSTWKTSLTINMKYKLLFKAVPEITSWEVQAGIGRLKANKSPGPDQINAELMKLFDDKLDS